MDAINETESSRTRMKESDYLVLSASAAQQFCCDQLEQLAVPAGEVSDCAEVMLEASLRGVDSHGIALVATFAERIRSGQMRPGRSLFVRREGPTSAWVDGQQGLGPTLARQCVNLAIGKAKRSGMAAVSLVDGNYLGALAPYLMPVAQANLFALAVANSTPRVAPYGGRSGLHGTNPIAWIAPVEGGEPLLFDAATGNAAARIAQAVDEGRPLAPGIALDEDGRETTDPAAAAAGTLLPVGAALGYGLGLLVDVLSGGLADAPIGPQIPPVRDWDSPYGSSFFVWVVDPSRFGGAEALARRCAALVHAAHGVPPAAGHDAVLVPGDRARACRAQRVKEGIPVHRLHWEAILKRLDACDLNVSRWRRQRVDRCD
jgi:LDH2 family malate/lactate/ureidoglycolate dehydrogenase